MRKAAGADVRGEALLQRENSLRWCEPFHTAAQHPRATLGLSARFKLTDSNPSARCGKPKESTMKNFIFAALAVLGLALGTASLTSPAHAAYSFAPPNQNNDS
jgi:hypothetical protein